MLRPVRDQQNISPEAVNDDASQRIVKAHFDRLRLAGKHTENAPAISGNVQLPRLRVAVARLGGLRDVRHFVHTVVRDAVALRMRDQIVILIVPAQGVGAGSVGAVAVMALTVNAPVKVAEGDLGIVRNGVVDAIHVIVDALVHGLDAAGDCDLTAEAARVMTAGEGLQLGDQLHGLALCQKARGLHRVHQKLQLRKLKGAGGEEEAAAAAAPRADIHAEVLQAGNVAVDAFTLGLNAPFREVFQNVLGGERVIFVALLLEQLPQIEKLPLLIVGSRHVRSLLFVHFIGLYRKMQAGLRCKRLMRLHSGLFPVIRNS